VSNAGASSGESRSSPSKYLVFNSLRSENHLRNGTTGEFCARKLTIVVTVPANN
jgi:hypothetical protein